MTAIAAALLALNLNDRSARRDINQEVRYAVGFANHLVALAPRNSVESSRGYYHSSVRPPISEAGARRFAILAGEVLASAHFS